jgi:beta-galactosidase/beta-glucuronidase
MTGPIRNRFVWSLGNESGHGANHDALYRWIKTTDPTRPVQYEGGGANTAATDIVCPMYARVDQDQPFPAVPKWSIKKWIGMPDESRPLILCEYAHAMGNSFGGFAKYWEAFRSHDEIFAAINAVSEASVSTRQQAAAIMRQHGVIYRAADFRLAD